MQSGAPLQSNSFPAVLPEPADPRWWLKSKTLYGIAILIATLALSKFRGQSVAPDDQVAITLADALLTLIGTGLALWGRADVQARLHAVSDALDEFGVPFSDIISGPDANGEIRAVQVGVPIEGGGGRIAAGGDGERAGARPSEPAVILPAVNGRPPLAGEREAFTLWPVMLLLAFLTMLGLALVCVSGCSAAAKPVQPPSSAGAAVPQAWTEVGYQPGTSAQLDTLFHDGRVIVPEIGNLSEAQFASEQWPRVELHTATSAATLGGAR